jgi:hypothetical protein
MQFLLGKSRLRQEPHELMHQPNTKLNYILHSVQTGSGAHTASYTMGTGGSFPGGKATEARSWPLTSI